MVRDVSCFCNSEYDLLIIGGGINGAGVAHLASLRGLKVALLEKNDFASGTSSKTTKLIHGGIRYLENFEFDLVKEALKERFIHVKNISHMVKPLDFIIPVYKGDKRPLWMMRLGVVLYDLLSGKYSIGRHACLKVEEVLSKVPGLRQDNLLGAVSYYDAQMNDARLCLENILSAQEKGAHVANYVEVTSFLKQQSKVVGVVAKDTLTGRIFNLRAKKIVCALGPWTNLFANQEKENLVNKIRMTKGIHIVYRGQISKYGLLIPSRADNRIFFIIPWLGNSLIGTTDTDYKDNPDNVNVEQKDIDYLLKEAKRVFPTLEFNQDNIITTFAGVRPLVHKKGFPSTISRKHIIEEAQTGVIYVMGGKYTTYRKIAEDCLKLILKKPIQLNPIHYTVYGSGVINEDLRSFTARYGLDEATIEYLISFYGTRFKEVLEITKENPSLKEKICDCTPSIKAQIVYAIKKEMAQTMEDIIVRRLLLEYIPCPTQRCRQEIQHIFSHYKFL